MNAALRLEFLKFHRALPIRVASAIIIVIVPLMSAGFLALARMDSDSILASKITPLLLDHGWGGLTGFAAQILSVGGLLAIGVVVSWVFGREFTEKTFGSLFATPTPRENVALAKLLVLIGWGAALSATTAVATLLSGFLIGLGVPDASAWDGVAQIVVIGILTVILALPLALVASAGRGYLVAIAALLGVVVLTQVTVALGAGAWFPYAAPGLWAGLGGPQLAADVTALQLLLAVPVGIAAAGGTWWWWRRAHVR